MWDPRIFTEPIVDLEEMKKPLAEGSPLNFMYAKPMKADESPVFYRNHAIDKLGQCASCSRKVKRHQYKRWKNAKTEEEKNETIVDPVTVANIALKNFRPLMKLLPMARGGVRYMVPYPMEEQEMEFRAMKMLREVCRAKAKRGAFKFKDILAHEFIHGANNDGFTIQAKHEHHKICEANRAFSHYRPEITAKIGQLVTNLPNSERVSGINEIRKLLTDVEDLLEQMELSVWELDASSPDRSKYDLRVKSYLNDKKQLEAELQKAIVRLKSDSNRDELLNFDEGIGLDQDQLIDNTERLERTSRKIHDTYRITVETEQIGAEVLGNLSQQRKC
uniref:Small ribosomal subunit protein uS7 domain-containing protein n=1 Tax=Ditylenchus dipsaci TaxID=166011 RepID=A0A915DS36_9BILA